jgi:hypothetical protein
MWGGRAPPSARGIAAGRALPPSEPPQGARQAVRTPLRGARGSPEGRPAPTTDPPLSPQPPKRGLSLDEKRATLLTIFHDTASVFTLKEVEKAGPKLGVVQQSVKEVLQSLVDDDLVAVDRIGIGNYYWSFPSAAGARAESEVARLSAAVEAATAAAAAAQAKLDAAAAGAPASAEREAALARMGAAEANVAAARATLADAAAFDPAAHAALLQAAIIARDAANRWLDNAHALKAWCTKKFEGAEGLDAFFRQAGLTDAVDYLD